MRTQVQRTAQLGELVVAVFDRAAHYSADPREVSRLATQAVAHILRRARKTSISLLQPARYTRATGCPN
jgi:uncharacterized protein (DUF2141 family)